MSFDALQIIKHQTIKHINNIFDGLSAPYELLQIIYQYYIDYKLSVVYVIDYVDRNAFTYIYNYDMGINNKTQTMFFLCCNINSMKTDYVSVNEMTNYIHMCYNEHTHYDVYILYRHTESHIQLFQTLLYPIHEIKSYLLNYIDNNILTCPYFTHTETIVEI